MKEQPFAEWLKELSSEQRLEAEAMVQAFVALGNDREHAEYLTRTDKSTPFPAFALFSLLHAVWEKINGWQDGNDIRHMIEAGSQPHNDPFSDADQAAARMVGAGASPADLAIFARGIAFFASFDVLNLLDNTYHPHRDERIGWDVVEFDPNRSGWARPIGPLHEALLRRDPSGRDGRPR